MATSLFQYCDYRTEHEATNLLDDGSREVFILARYGDDGCAVERQESK